MTTVVHATVMTLKYKQCSRRGRESVIFPVLSCGSWFLAFLRRSTSRSLDNQILNVTFFFSHCRDNYCVSFLVVRFVLQ